MEMEQVKSIITDLWSPKGKLPASPLGKGYIMFRFEDICDYQRVWDQGSWMVEQHVLRLCKWIPNFSTEREIQSHAAVWVRFPRLGLEYWEVKNLMEIGKAMGKLIHVDETTNRRELGYYARVLESKKRWRKKNVNTTQQKDTIIIDVPEADSVNEVVLAGATMEHVSLCTQAEITENTRAVEMNNEVIVRDNTEYEALNSTVVTETVVAECTEGGFEAVNSADGTEVLNCVDGTEVLYTAGGSKDLGTVVVFDAVCIEVVSEDKIVEDLRMNEVNTVIFTTQVDIGMDGGFMTNQLPDGGHLIILLILLLMTKYLLATITLS
ncbi:hypothetical protein IFM89_019744 [Coptis chinensis]|uniref:DUF4283 domain-containing protein n=1 Tax=Coptis chinensis TaxID=261450 RepID=A0A835LHU2_9MAGN|nr:hypothetical protein IFM89_019744 [Coptis chinensis]